MQQCFCSGQVRRGKRDEWGASNDRCNDDGLKVLKSIQTAFSHQILRDTIILFVWPFNKYQLCADMQKPKTQKSYVHHIFWGDPPLGSNHQKWNENQSSRLTGWVSVWGLHGSNKSNTPQQTGTTSTMLGRNPFSIFRIVGGIAYIYIYISTYIYVASSVSSWNTHKMLGGEWIKTSCTTSYLPGPPMWIAHINCSSSSSSRSEAGTEQQIIAGHSTPGGNANLMDKTGPYIEKTRKTPDLGDFALENSFLFSRESHQLQIDFQISHISQSWKKLKQTVRIGCFIVIGNFVLARLWFLFQP